MKTIIVVPTFNERENVKELTEKIFNLGVADLEILFVDDNSPDGTADVISGLAGVYPVRLLKRPAKLGLGSAYVAGFKLALASGADLIMEMDADLSHAPSDIPRLINACVSGADLSIGSRRVEGGKIAGWGWWRRFESAGASWFSRLLLGLKTKDVTAGFRCFRRRALEAAEIGTIQSNGYAFQEELLWRLECAGFKITEVPVVFTERRRGKSKLSKKDVLEFFWRVLKLRLSGRV